MHGLNAAADDNAGESSVHARPVQLGVRRTELRRESSTLKHHLQVVIFRKPRLGVRAFFFSAELVQFTVAVVQPLQRPVSGWKREYKFAIVLAHARRRRVVRLFGQKKNTLTKSWFLTDHDL